MEKAVETLYSFTGVFSWYLFCTGRLYGYCLSQVCMYTYICSRFTAIIFSMFLFLSHKYWGIYFSALSFFHWSEYMITALCNARKLEYACKYNDIEGPGSLFYSIIDLFLTIFYFSLCYLHTRRSFLVRCHAAFLLDNGRAYQLAAVCSWAEYWIEAYFFPWMKICRVAQLGLCISVF